ncbi:MAG: hypothetical protein NZM06_11355 [Chloroherpetonaceae bacterium]|nr:hypothetical protein [Chloroherpetonaceae bacterium]
MNEIRKPFENVWLRLALMTLCAIAMALSACEENPINKANTFSMPETSVIAERIFVNQQAEVTLAWSGTARDGFVGGFMLTFDSTRWGTQTASAFTTRQDSTFRLTFFSLDTTFTLFVAACRLDNGNGRYDTALLRGRINFGREPFVDANRNGRYDEGEPFTDIGSIDETPARATFPVRNSPPTLERKFLTLVPDTSLPITQFEFRANDRDGIGTLRGVQLCLNDSTFPANKTVEIRIFERDLTVILESVSPTSTGVTEANVYVGSSNVPLPARLPDYRMNAPNVLYARAVDAPGATSPTVRVPSADSIWVPRPLSSSPLVVIDDFAPADRDPFDAFNSAGAPLSSERVLPEVFGRIRGGRYLSPQYETIALKAPVISPNPLSPATRERLRRQAIQNSSPDVLKKLLRRYQVAFWYADNNPSFLVAQLALPDVLNGGTNVMMTTGTSTDRDALSLSFSSASSARLVPQTWFRTPNPSFVTFERHVGDAAFPTLSFNGDFRFGSYSQSAHALQFNPENPADIVPLYSLPLSFPMIAQNQLDTASRYVVSRRIYRQAGQERGRIVFCSFPMYRVVVRSDAPTITDTTALRRFYDAVFDKEFRQ